MCDCIHLWRLNVYVGEIKALYAAQTRGSLMTFWLRAATLVRMTIKSSARAKAINFLRVYNLILLFIWELKKKRRKKTITNNIFCLLYKNIKLSVQQMTKLSGGISSAARRELFRWDGLSLTMSNFAQNKCVNYIVVFPFFISKSHQNFFKQKKNKNKISNFFLFRRQRTTRFECHTHTTQLSTGFYIKHNLLKLKMYKRQNSDVDIVCARGICKAHCHRTHSGWKKPSKSDVSLYMKKEKWKICKRGHTQCFFFAFRIIILVKKKKTRVLRKQKKIVKNLIN